MSMYRIIIFLTFIATNCLAEEVSHSDISGEWWGGVDGRLSQVMTIDDKNLYLPISAGHYKGKLFDPLPYELAQKDGRVILQFTYHKKQYSPTIVLPQADKLLMTFSDNIDPPWNTSARGKTFVYLRTPDKVDESALIGQWINQKSGFMSGFLHILEDGSATLIGAVSGVELCWKRNNKASIKIAVCDKKNTALSELQEFYMILSPTPTKERIIVQTSEDKSIWKRVKDKSQ